MNTCENCGKEFDLSIGIKSKRFCSLHCRATYSGKKTVEHKTERGIPYFVFRNSNGHSGWTGEAGTCKHCGRYCHNQNSLKNHERLCKENPNRQVIRHVAWNKGKPAWNRGLSKETNSSIARGSSLKKRKYASGELIHYSKDGRDMTTTRKKLSANRIAYLMQHPESNPYIIRRQHRNFAEKFFADVFFKNGLSFEQEYMVGRYFLDFAFPDKKCYIEVDGEQHYWDEKQVEHDNLRTQTLSKMGWTLLERIRWRDFQRLSDQEKSVFIDSMLHRISLL